MWFTETAWPPIFTLLASAAISLLAWRSNGRKPLLIAAVVFLALCPAAYLLEILYVTEPEQVEQRIPALLVAVESDQPDDVLKFFAEENRGDRQNVELGMSQFRVVGAIRITDVQVRYADDKSAIISHFRANGEVQMKATSGQNYRFTTRWELTWKRSGDAWRITKTQRLDPLNGEAVDMLARE